MTGASGRVERDERVAMVRAFNRRYTAVLGLLRQGLLETRWTLGEARVLYELAFGGAEDTTVLRTRLGLDRGHLSRLLAKLEADGALRRQRHCDDGRRQVVTLTPAGQRAAKDLDARSAAAVATLLAPLGQADQHRLVGAMAGIESVLGLAESQAADRGPTVILRPPRPGDLGWIVERNAVVYAAQYGWDASYEALVARIVADHAERADGKTETAWIAEVDGARAGGVLCVRDDTAEGTARLRLLLVDPAARGLGIGTRLVAECVRFARSAGYRRITLWTNDVLTSARPIYEAAGFELIAEAPHHSFSQDLVGQDWSLDL
ncbi:helix-turn-helix domain-containing GNAT family N-acetyltransferase [soil metagenome]